MLMATSATSNKDVKDLLRKAAKQGFEVLGSGCKHIKLRCSECGQIIGISRTPSGHSAIYGMRADLKRHGYVDPRSNGSNGG
jgi:hypothetical protein